MSWRTGAHIFSQIWPIIKENIEDKNERVDMGKALIGLFSDFDMDPADLEGLDQDIDEIIGVGNFDYTKQFVCITGDIEAYSEGYSKDEIIISIEEGYGSKFQEFVDSKTTLLFIGDNPDEEEIALAKKNGVTILSFEEEFCDMYL